MFKAKIPSTPGVARTGPAQPPRIGRTRRRRALAAVGATIALSGGLLSVATVAAQADKPVQVGGTATNLRDCYHPKQGRPGTSCTRIAQIGAGTPVTLICQYPGENISGDVWWDYVKTPNNGYGYMSDYYVNTGQSAYRVPGIPECSY